MSIEKMDTKAAEVISEKDNLVNMILRKTLIDLQCSGSGYFNIDPRTFPEGLPIITVLNIEVKLINERKSDMSASQRIKCIKLHKELHKGIKNETDAVGTKQ